MKFFARIISGIVLLASLSACQEKDYLVTISTTYGEMKMVLFDETPLHKKSFISMAQSGHYDSTIFHRVMEEFMIQGGDVNQKPNNKEPNNTLINAEFRPGLIHTKGMVAGARQPDNINPQKRSGIQFYIVQGKKYMRGDLNKMNEDSYYTTLVARLNQLFQQGRMRPVLEKLIALQKQNDLEAVKKLCYDNKEIVEAEFGVIPQKKYTDEQYELYETIGGAPFLDWDYTVFGKVVEGLEVIDAIAAVQKDGGDKPLENIYMVVSVEKIPKMKITEMYGIKYPETQ